MFNFSKQLVQTAQSSPASATCYHEAGCPSGYFETKPDSRYFTYTSTAGGSTGTCYQVTGCKTGYILDSGGEIVYSPHYENDGIKCYKKVNLPEKLRLNIGSTPAVGFAGTYLLTMHWNFYYTNTIQNNVDYTMGNISSFQAIVSITRESDTLIGHSCTCPAAGANIDTLGLLECVCESVHTLNHDHTNFKSCTGTVNNAESVPVTFTWKRGSDSFSRDVNLPVTCAVGSSSGGLIIH